MPVGHSSRGLVSMQKCTNIRAFPAPNFAPPQPLPAAQSCRGLTAARRGHQPKGQQEGSPLRHRCKEAPFGAGKRLGYSSCLLALLAAVVLLMSGPMATHGSSEVGPRGQRLKRLLQEALNSKDPRTALADAVKNGGVRVLAVDFDKTMISAHSGGSASDVPDNHIFTALAQDFDAFAAAAASRGVRIAVVTFGDPKGTPSDRLAGEALVRRVLRESAASFDVDAVFAFYPPLYRQPDDYKPLGLDGPMPYNKSYHITKVQEQFGVTMEEVLLIDDDLNNCVSFAADGGVALRVGGDQGFEFASLEVI